MKPVIDPVAADLIENELTPERLLRRTNNGGNEIYVMRAQECPNLMREIGRLRELSFRDGGGGTGADVHTTAVKDALLTELSAIDRAPLPRAENIAMPRREPVRRVEHFDTTQAKLCMLFTLGQPMQPGQLAAVRLAMALYGGSVTSRLFLNVRERDHLCYYCSSSFQSFTGSMAVNSGVEHADAARAEAAVLKELKDLCDGPITDEELEDCRRGLLAGMNGLEDTLGGIETWYYMEVLRGGPVQTPDDARRALLAVTKEEVRDILRQFTLSVSCLLTREEGDENG